MMIEGAIDGEVLELYVEHFLVPELQPGDIVLWDNIPTHKNKRAITLIEAKGARVEPLPAYSPDLDPIEECISKVKTELRRAKAGTVQELRNTLKRAFATVTAQDARGWFKHCSPGKDFDFFVYSGDHDMDVSQESTPLYGESHAEVQTAFGDYRVNPVGVNLRGNLNYAGRARAFGERILRITGCQICSAHNSTEVRNSQPDIFKDESSRNLKLILHIEQHSHSILQNILVLFDVFKRTNGIQSHSPLFITRVEISIYPYHLNHLTRAGLGLGVFAATRR